MFVERDLVRFRHLCKHAFNQLLVFILLEVLHRQLDRSPHVESEVYQRTTPHILLVGVRAHNRQEHADAVGTDVVALLAQVNQAFGRVLEISCALCCCNAGGTRILCVPLLLVIALRDVNCRSLAKVVVEVRFGVIKFVLAGVQCQNRVDVLGRLLVDVIQTTVLAFLNVRHAVDKTHVEWVLEVVLRPAEPDSAVGVVLDGRKGCHKRTVLK